MFKLRGVRARNIVQRGIGFDDAVRDEIAHLDEPETVS
jgi:hypothetical protein